MNTQNPRGIRNNNPLNIRISNNNWLGKLKPSRDSQFETFDTADHGIRAAFLCVRTYINKYHADTLQAVISRWAPASENNTQAYCLRVCKLSGLSARQQLRFADSHQMCLLLWAMHQVECGGEYYPLTKFAHVYEQYFL